MIVNNSMNINKTNGSLWPQNTDHEEITIYALVILVLIFDTQLWTWCAEYHTGTRVSKRPDRCHMVFWPPCSICIHGILIALIENWSSCVVNLTPMVYQTPYPWYFDHPIHGILSPPTNGISNPLSMVFWSPIHRMVTPYPWYIEPPIHGISNPYSWYIGPPNHGIVTLLPMVYWMQNCGRGGLYKYPLNNFQTAKFLPTWSLVQKYCPVLLLT